MLGIDGYLAASFIQYNTTYQAYTEQSIGLNKLNVAKINNAKSVYLRKTRN
jgi:hypothetical protein